MQTCEFKIGLFCFEYEGLKLNGTSIDVLFVVNRKER